MRYLALAALLILPTAHDARAEALSPPVCARPAVLDRLAALLYQAGRPMRLEPAPIGEISTEPSPIVHCAARGQMLGYDTTRYRTQPIDALFVVHYTLELRHNGIFIRLQ